MDPWIGVAGTLLGALVGAAITAVATWKGADIQAAAARQIARDAGEQAIRERRVGDARAYIYSRLQRVVSARSEAQRALDQGQLFQILLPAMKDLREHYQALPRSHLFDLETTVYDRIDAFAIADRASVEVFARLSQQPRTASEAELTAAFDPVERTAIDALDAIDRFIVASSGRSGS